MAQIVALRRPKLLAVGDTLINTFLHYLRNDLTFLRLNFT